MSARKIATRSGVVGLLAQQESHRESREPEHEHEGREPAERVDEIGPRDHDRAPEAPPSGGRLSITTAGTALPKSASTTIAASANHGNRKAAGTKTTVPTPIATAHVRRRRPSLHDERRGGGVGGAEERRGDDEHDDAPCDVEPERGLVGDRDQRVRVAAPGRSGSP